MDLLVIEKVAATSNMMGLIHGSLKRGFMITWSNGFATEKYDIETMTNNVLDGEKTSKM